MHHELKVGKMNQQVLKFSEVFNHILMNEHLTKQVKYFSIRLRKGFDELSEFRTAREMTSDLRVQSLKFMPLSYSTVATDVVEAHVKLKILITL